MPAEPFVSFVIDQENAQPRIHTDVHGFRKEIGAWIPHAGLNSNRARIWTRSRDLVSHPIFVGSTSSPQAGGQLQTSWLGLHTGGEFNTVAVNVKQKLS